MSEKRQGIREQISSGNSSDLCAADAAFTEGGLRPDRVESLG